MIIRFEYQFNPTPFFIVVENQVDNMLSSRHES